MEITKELFQVPYKGRTFLYAPLEGSVLEVNDGLISFLNKVQEGKDPRQLNSELTEKLIKSRILVERSAELKNNSCDGHPKEYAPTSVTLLPTFDCNLKCVYCYARAGEDIGSIMKPEIAKASLDLIVSNALKVGAKQVSLGFHGGGEPLLKPNMPLLNYAINYLREKAQENNLKYRINAVSNGVHSKETMDWAIENLDNLNISIDGPESIQNGQRPRAGGQDSFENVVQTISYLENAKGKDGKKFPYGLRATITAASVNQMPEIIRFFTSISKNKSFHLEPLFECGRCLSEPLEEVDLRTKSPDANLYLAKLLETQAEAKKLGVEVYYSGGSLEKMGSTFCGACGSNFFVTPNGFTTTCLEACRERDAISNVFFIGKYNPSTKIFDLNQERINNLSQRKVENISHCEDCFAKYNCSGDCPAKVYEQTGNLMDPSKNWRCIINQGLLVERMADALDRCKEHVTKLEATSKEKNC